MEINYWILNGLLVVRENIEIFVIMTSFKNIEFKYMSRSQVVTKIVV